MIHEVGQIEYNTERPSLIIPEYGRHIQKMVDYAVSLESKEDRNKIARSIISVMGNLNPHLRDVPDFQPMLWDQLFIISDFKLDVDSPYPIPTKEELNERPQPLKYPQNHPKYRFYGNNIKRMIDVAKDWEDGDKKDGLILTIANHMKKSLFELSEGKINLKQSQEDLSNAADLLKSKKRFNNTGVKNKNHKAGGSRGRKRH